MAGDRFTYVGYARLDGGATVWWYYRGERTGLFLGVRNARPEPNEDGGTSIEYDEVAVCEHPPDDTGAGYSYGVAWPHRPLTEEEGDEYMDDLREALRGEDYGD